MRTHRTSRIVMVVALVLGLVAVDLARAEPAAAVAPTVDFFEGETLTITADPAPGGSLNLLRATFVIHHDAGLTVNAMRTHRGINASGFSGWGSVGGSVTKVEADGLAYTTVQAEFSPGTGNWPDFTCGIFSGYTRRRTGTAQIQLRMSNGVELPAQGWAYATASESQCTGATDYAMAYNNHDSTVNATIASSSTFRVSYSCDDNDSSGTNDNCDYAHLRVRRLSDNNTFALTCTAGMACNNTAPTANFNADDNVQRTFDIPHPGAAGSRGRFVVEGEFCGEDNCTESNAGWQWLGSYRVNDAAPSVTLSGSASFPGTATASTFGHPATNATITATAATSSDAQVLEWDLDNNGGFETTRMGTSGSSSARVLSAGQKTVTRDLTGAAPGSDCSVRARVRDNGALSGSDAAAKTSGIFTLPCTVNRLPAGAPQSVNVTPPAPQPITLTASDADGDPDTCEILSPPSNGTLSGGTGCGRTYTWASGTSDSFTYRVHDDHNGSSPIYTVLINVVATPSVAGVVTDEVTSAPIEGITVEVFDNADPNAIVLAASVLTDANGAYDTGNLAAGSYLVRFRDLDRDYLTEWHDDVTRQVDATPVTVAVVAVTVDAALTPGATVSGVVTSSIAPNGPVADLQVRLYRVGESPSSARNTEADGSYEFDLLVAGQYELWFRDVSSGQWVSEWYDEAGDRASATSFSVGVGQDVVVDEDLMPVVIPPPPSAGVQGTVTSTEGGAPIADLQVRIYRDGETTSSATKTDASGHYSFSGLEPGDYKVWFRDLNTDTWFSEYHADQPTLATATIVTVTTTMVTVDAELAPKQSSTPTTGTVTGTVTEADGVTPIADLQVRIYVEGVTSGSKAVVTDASGQYSFTGLAPGSYQVWFRDLTRTWTSEWYLDASSQAASTPVAVPVGTTVVDASLDPR